MPGLTKEQEKQLEIERRDCLARYLVRLKADQRRRYLNRMKSDTLREEMRTRMREQLAIHIASLDKNMRNLRLSSLYRNCQRNQEGHEFFQDVLRRVNEKLPEETQEHG